MESVLILGVHPIGQVKPHVFNLHVAESPYGGGKGAKIPQSKVANGQIFNAVKFQPEHPVARARKQHFFGLVGIRGFFGGGIVQLIEAVLVIGAAFEHHVAGLDFIKIPIVVGDDSPVGLRHLVKSAIAGQTLNGGVGMHPQSRNQRRTVHNQVHTAANGRFIQRGLQRGGIVGTAAGIYVTVQLGNFTGENGFDPHSITSLSDCLQCNRFFRKLQGKIIFFLFAAYHETKQKRSGQDGFYR